MTNKMKLPSILALIVIIFLSLSAVSASENIDLVTNATDSAIDDTIAISDSNNNLTSGFDDSNHEITDNDLITDTNDLDDEITSPKESNKLGSSYEDPDTLSSEPIIIDSSSYSQLFAILRFRWKNQIRCLERWRYNQNQKYLRQDIYYR